MTMFFVLSKDFVKVANAEDIQPLQMKTLEVGGEIIGVLNVEEKYSGSGNVCTHQGDPSLADGGYDVDLK
jgi:nitrite reductase/ring-hydroxylating ferredoxin subunit